MRLILTTALIVCAGSAWAETRTIAAAIWADNWFEMSVNGDLVLEDSVPITTERSFNAETITFTAQFPMTIAITAMDFRENDTGLEYIGSRRQQMGDGGMIAQFRDTATGQIVGVTNSDMRCLVVHHAPIAASCADERNPVAGQGACGFEITEVPANWTSPQFDDSAWPAAVELSVRAVRPKDGYDEINWDRAAQLIWSSDLELDNTLLCRVTIDD
jgi:hypothetical protein